MYRDLARADLQQLFSSSLVLHYGRLVWVKELKGGFFNILDLESRQLNDIPIDDIEFKSVDRHLGMVNFPDECVHISRKPIRLFSVGLTVDNTRIDKTRGLLSPASILSSKELIKAYNGEYPSVEEAYETAKKNRSFAAFDKSFCLDYEGNVYYKTMKRVGVYRRNGFEFIREFSYLKHRIGESYGKDYRPVPSR